MIDFLIAGRYYRYLTNYLSIVYLPSIYSVVSNSIFRGNLFHVWLCVTNHKFASIPSFKYANLNSFWLGNLTLSFYQIFTFVSIKCSNKISIYGAWYLVSRLLWLCSVQKNIFIFVTKLLGAITAIFGALIYWIQFKIFI